MNGSNTYYEYDAANQLTRKGTNALFASATYYTHDKNGSLTDLVEPGGITKFAYNAAGAVQEEYTNAKSPTRGIGQLVEVNRPGSSPQKLYLSWTREERSRSASRATAPSSRPQESTTRSAT